MKIGDYVRVVAGEGAIEGKVVYINKSRPKNAYNLVGIETGFRVETVPDDLYDIEVLRVAVPIEPIALGTVHNGYVRWTNNTFKPWISSETGLLYTWEEIWDKE